LKPEFWVKTGVSLVLVLAFAVAVSTLSSCLLREKTCYIEWPDDIRSIKQNISSDGDVTYSILLEGETIFGPPLSCPVELIMSDEEQSRLLGANVR